MQTGFDKSKYTLMAENASTGTKLYSKLMNGIPTDDCYIEYYENNILVDTYKTEFVLEDCDVQASASQTNAVLAANPNVNAANLSYTYVDGEWHLIERREVTIAHDGIECTEIIYVDLTEGGEMY